MITSINDYILTSTANDKTSAKNTQYQTKDTGTNSFFDILNNINQKATNTAQAVAKKTVNTKAASSKNQPSTKNNNSNSISTGVKKDNNQITLNPQDTRATETTVKQKNTTKDKTSSIKNDKMKTTTNDEQSVTRTDAKEISSDTSNSPDEERLPLYDETTNTTESVEPIAEKETETSETQTTAQPTQTEVEIQNSTLLTGAAANIAALQELNQNTNEAASTDSNTLAPEIKVNTVNTVNTIEQLDNIINNSANEKEQQSIVQSQITEVIANDVAPELTTAMNTDPKETQIDTTTISIDSDIVADPGTDIANSKDTNVATNEVNETHKNEAQQKNSFATEKLAAQIEETQPLIHEESEINSQEYGEQPASTMIKTSEELVTPNKVSEKSNDNIGTINQDLITELDAEVVSSSLSSGNSNNGSLLGQQNASDQIVKLSIVSSTSETNDSEFSHLVNQQISQSGVSKSQMSAQPQPLQELNKTDILNQINANLNTLKTTSGEKIEMILQPANLGKVNIELQTAKGALSATIIAESQQVKELLEKNIDSLKNTLTSQGVNVNSVTVKVDESRSAFNNAGFDQKQFENGQNNQQNQNKNTYKGEYNDSNNSSLAGQEKDLELAADKGTNTLPEIGKVDYKV